jgi:glucan endo-1,3-alpha-glucosidase
MLSTPLPLNQKMLIGFVHRITNIFAQERVTRVTQTEDYLWAVVFAVSPAQVTLISGSTSTWFEVASGVTKLKVPCSLGAQCANLSRNGKALIQLRPMGFNFMENPEAYNFNAFVAVSP